MPLKWKIFRATNYSLLFLTLGVLALLSYFFFDSPGKEPVDIGYFIIFVIGMLIISANFCNNIVLTDRHYPSRAPEENFKIFSGVIFFFTCLLIGFISIAIIAHLYDLVVHSAIEAKQFLTKYIVELLVLVYFMICYYVLWMQVALRKTIKRNAAAELDKFLL